MPERKNAGGIGRAPFAYATIRVVPRVEREEFVNVGVVLYSRPRKYLGVQARLDVDRLRALWLKLDLDAVARRLDVIRLVVAGTPRVGRSRCPSAAERFGWLHLLRQARLCNRDRSMPGWRPTRQGLA